MILILDNYDSFTWNLYHYVEQLCDEHIEIRRNDQISLSEISHFSSIILSPGPGLPSESGIMPELIKEFSPKIPILGVCLGHQAIAESFGATIENLNHVWHGIQKDLVVVEKNDRLFKGLPSLFSSGHYHSWVIKKDSLPDDFLITAVDNEGTIMAFSHKKLPLSGVQFHPESVLTDHGLEIINNWLKFCGYK